MNFSRRRRAVADQWRRLPVRTRLDVLRLAKRSERHPDDAVDEAAVALSRMVLEQPSFLHTTVFQALLSLGLLTVAVLWDDPFPRWCAGAGGALCLILTIYHWDLKRDARRILAVPR